MKLTRRTFLGGSVALAGLAACGGKRDGSPDPGKHPEQRSAPPPRTASANPARGDQPTTEPSVIDVRGEQPGAMVAAALKALGGIGAFVSAGQRVVIKPNGAFAAPPEWGATTHPETVAAVVRACLEADAAEILVLEYPGRGRGETCLKHCGIAGALAGLPRTELRVLNDGSPFRTVAIEGGTELTSVDVSAAVLDADVLIDLPAAKAHHAAGVSFGIKNTMGLIRDRRALHDRKLDLAIADLARVIRPDLTILDATRALLDNGPGGPGTTVKPGRMIAGRNVVSVDAFGLSVAEFDHRRLTPKDVPHIARAGEIGLGEIDFDRIRVTPVEA